MYSKTKAERNAVVQKVNAVNCNTYVKLKLYGGGGVICFIPMFCNVNII